MRCSLLMFHLTTTSRFTSLPFDMVLMREYRIFGRVDQKSYNKKFKPAKK